MIYCFGDFALDEARFELRRGGHAVQIQPKALQLLLHLVRNRGRVVSKREILDAVWPDAQVTEGSLLRAVSLVRAALGDRGVQPGLVVTVARRGYRFEAELREAESLPRSSGLAPADDPAARYVGRAALIARLEERLDGALAGSGRILFLAGEAGIGKTRTAELLAARARHAGACVITSFGPCEDAPAHSSWAHLLRSLAASTPEGLAALAPDARAGLARLVPEIDSVPEPKARPRAEDAESFALFDAVQRFLAVAAGIRPLAMFLDDLQAADAETIALLEFVGQSITALPCAIVVTCLDEEGSGAPRHARAIERLLRLTALERWPLPGLDAEEIREFAGARVGGEAAPELITALERQTGGNPLLMGESLRSLEARGLLGVARTLHEWEALLPRGIRHLLLPKLRRLSTAASEALGCAAALGIEVERDVLGCCVADAASVDACLAEAFAVGLLLAPPATGERPRFAHALVREALYEELVPAGERRQAVHARISDTLERRAGGAAEALAERAHHACEGVPLVPAERAIDLARRAGERAASALDFDGAATWYERALSWATPGEPILRVELLLGLGAAQTRALGLERARASYREAADYARTLARGELLAQAALGFAHRPDASGGANAEAIRLLEEARPLVPPEDERLSIRIASRLAVELRYGERERAERLMDEAVAAARRLDDPAVLAQTLDDCSFVRWSPVDPQAWIELNAEVAWVAEAAGDLELALSGQRGVATGHLELGDLPGVQRTVRACARIAEALRTPQARWFHIALNAMTTLLAGDLASAEAQVAEALAFGDRLDSREVDLERGIQFAYLRFEQGRAREIEPAVRLQAERFADTPGWRAALARVQAAAGLRADARATLEALASHAFADVPRDRGYLPTLAMALDAAYAVGDASALAAIEPRLTPFARLHVVAGSGLMYSGSVSHALGLAAAARGHWPEAIARFEAAQSAEEALGARLWVARSSIALGGALQARGAPGDRKRAATLLRASLRAARAHGWRDVEAGGRELEAALWRRGAPAPRRIASGAEG